MRVGAAIFVIAAVIGPAGAARSDCPDLPVSHQPLFSPDQAGAAMVGPPVTAKPPARHVSVPQGPLSSVRITLDRTECYGSCPSYSLELGGDGSAVYIGRAFVLVPGRHTFNVSPERVACLLEQFRRADFWSLNAKYVADITDGSEYRLTLTVGDQSKTVVDYFGTTVGMPDAVTALEDAIDRIGADRWLKGDDKTLATLRQEHFDFHSPAAATILANAARAAPDDLVLGLIAAGTPVTGRVELRPGWLGMSAVAAASLGGRINIVNVLIAHGAFANATADAKGEALQGAALSGDPLVVAEILKYGPNINARGNQGDTALMDVRSSRKASPAQMVEITRRLLDAGADPNIRDTNGSTALFDATNADVVGLLLKAGADVNATNKFGMTPLLTVESDTASVALIEAGADMTVTARFGGETVEKHATAMKFPKTLRMLHDSKPQSTTH